MDAEELRRTQPPVLELLPAELILLVSEILPETDAVCLALTCRRLCNISNVGYLARRLDEGGRETLLCRLEQDVTGVSYCPVAQRLVPFDIYKSAGVCMHTHRFNRKPTPPDLSFGGTLRIPYCTARAATNYEILGPEHGIPISHLEETLDHIHSCHGVCWKEELAAKLINGELFAFSRHTFYQERADAGALRFCLYNKSINLCPHMAVGLSQCYRVIVGLPMSLIGNREDYETGWCQKCETDWKMSIGKDPQRGWTVKITTYRGLGTCRSPWAGKWEANTIRRRPPM